MTLQTLHVFTRMNGTRMTDVQRALKRWIVAAAFGAVFAVSGPTEMTTGAYETFFADPKAI